ncbi:MAG TPA: glycosyltransferase [Conexibacter sp.]|nr:glycosyltransferase [Conexibacter sp.]
MPESRTAPRKTSRAGGGAAEAAGARIDALTFLGASFVLALVSGLSDPERPLRGWLLDDGRRQRLTATTLSADGETAVLLLGGGRKPLATPPTGSIELVRPDGRAAAAPVSLAQANVAPEQLGARLRDVLDASSRARLQERVLAGVARTPATLADAGSALAALHDAARERLPAPAGGPSAAYAAHLDGFWRVDRSSYYVEGWAFDRAAQLSALRLVSPEGRRIELLRDAFRYARPDVCTHFGVPATERLGFIAFVELPEECASDEGWTMQGELSDGGGFELEAPSVVDQPLTVRTTILGDVDLDAGDSQLLSGHVAPALTRLQRRLSESVAIDAVDQHGTPPAEPEVTIVVPLYRRTEFLEHQLAQFVHDPELHRADLIYVLDSPEEGARLRRFARHLHDLYGVPFRLAVLSANGGYSIANNLGASLARGRKLLLLNSDVLPAQPGWLSRMVAFSDTHPDVGALAPKLLYEDDSIQHAGMRFERNLECDGEAGWWNEHFYKGLHRRFEAANVSRAVPAVTGACMLIDTALFHELGGLRGVYVRGDYEDSDLCLRLREQGRASWYLADVELYHLEGQSYPTPERAAASRYNQWLHSDLWRAALTELEHAA